MAMMAMAVIIKGLLLVVSLSSAFVTLEKDLLTSDLDSPFSRDISHEAV